MFFLLICERYLLFEGENRYFNFRTSQAIGNKYGYRLVLIRIVYQYVYMYIYLVGVFII